MSLGTPAALERSGRQERLQHLLGPLVGAGQVGHDDPHHHEGRFSFEQALQRERPVAVVLEALHPLVQLQALVLEGVGQLVREDQLLGHVRHPGERFDLLGVGVVLAGLLQFLRRPLDDVEAARLRVVEGDDLRGVEIDEPVDQPGRRLDQPEGRERLERVLRRDRKGFAQLGAEDLAQVAGVDLAGRDGPLESFAADLFDFPGHLIDPRGQQGGGAQDGRGREKQREEPGPFHDAAG